jgi:hypothetical protein
MVDTDADNRTIKRLIESNQPFFIGRIAGVELQIAHHVMEGKNYLPELEGLEQNAGMYTKNDASVHEYVAQLVKTYDHCTVIAEWEKTGSVFAFHGMGQELITKRTPHIPKISALALEPYYCQDSWMSSLRGKRILIIHPFVDTIQKQIKKLALLFPGRSWFEDCEITCLSPPLTLAGNHQGKDWQEHYTTFVREVEQVVKAKSFDLALVAAGGYGMLVSDFLFTELHLSVMYVGGALQLFFGIIGKRWFDNKRILELVNDEWVRPGKVDKPTNCTRVEKGCYW